MKETGGKVGNLKIVLAVALGAFLMLFALQNIAKVELTILLWTFEARRIVVIALSFCIGFIIGLLVKASSGRKKAGWPAGDV